MRTTRETLESRRVLGSAIAALAAAQLLQGCMDGCSHLGRPGPTTKPVTAQHVVGSWTYDLGHASIEIHADGTFRQRTPKKKDRASTHEQDGRWTLDGPRIEFVPWYFHDWPFKDDLDSRGAFYLTDFRGPELHIFGGGCPDPATWTIWTRVEAVNPK